jgi:hypothetical protein
MEWLKEGHLLSESGCPGFKDLQDFCWDLDFYDWQIRRVWNC